MRLDNGRVRIYIADIRPLFEEKLQSRVYERLDIVRQKKADACKKPEARAASLAAGFLAKYALDDMGYGGCKIAYTESGKPVAVCLEAETEQCSNGKDRNAAAGNCEALPGKRHSLYLSLSHSGDYAVCAVSQLPVGVDIQKEQPIRTGMLRHFYAGEERVRFLERYGICEEEKFLPKEAADEFLRCWTAKESYVKLDGAGMSLGFANIAVDLEMGHMWEKAAVEWTTERDDAGEQFTKRNPVCLREYRAPDGYYLSACFQTADD